MPPLTWAVLQTVQVPTLPTAEGATFTALTFQGLELTSQSLSFLGPVIKVDSTFLSLQPFLSI